MMIDNIIVGFGGELCISIQRNAIYYFQTNNVLRKRKNKSQRDLPFDKLKIRPIRVARIKHVVIIFLRREGFSFFCFEIQNQPTTFLPEKKHLSRKGGKFKFSNL